MLEEKLQQLGLSDKEAKVYIAMLKLGVSTASQISKESGVRRATTYMILDTLEEKGFVLKMERKKVLFYYPEEPEKFTEILINEEKKLKEKFLTVTSILPDLNELYKTAKAPPRFKIIQGNEAVQKIKADLESKKINTFYDLVPVTKEMAPFFKEKGRHKILVTQVKNLKTILGIADTKVKLIKSKNLSAKYISLEKYPFDCEVLIYGNITAFFKADVVSVVIENDQIAQMMKSFFNNIWDNAKDYKYFEK